MQRFGFRAVLKVSSTLGSKLARMIKLVVTRAYLPRGHKILVKKTKGSSPSQTFEEKDKSRKYDPTIGARQNC